MLMFYVTKKIKINLEKRFNVNLKKDFIKGVRFLDVIKEDSIIFFDMDGTIVDTDFANFLAYQQAISETVKYDLNVEYDPNSRFNRNSLKNISPLLSEFEYLEIIERKEEIYHNYLNEIQVYNDELNVAIEYAKSNRVILVTNSCRSRAMSILNYLGIYKYFDEVFCQESISQIGGTNKFKNAISKMGISPRCVIAFENEESEVLLAIEAGIEIINPTIGGCYA